MERHAGGRERPVESEGERHPEDEGHDDADVTDRDRDASLTAQSKRLQLDADDEHEQQHPDLTEELQDRQRGVGKQGAARRRRQPAEQRGAERQPSRDLADHRRLSDASRQPAERSGGEHDHDQLEEEARERRSRRVEHRRES